MDSAMAIGAKGNQVLRCVSAQGASPTDVVDLQVICGPAALASRAIAFEHLSAEAPVGLRFEPKPSLLRRSLVRNPHCMRCENSAF
jgi:hypothetical protein